MIYSKKRQDEIMTLHAHSGKFGPVDDNFGLAEKELTGFERLKTRLIKRFYLWNFDGLCIEDSPYSDRYELIQYEYREALKLFDKPLESFNEDRKKIKSLIRSIKRTLKK